MSRVNGTYLYMLVAANGLIKIGVTDNLYTRVTNIMTASPIEVLFHAAFLIRDDKIARNVETLVHRRLQRAGLRVRGEWFSASLPEAQEEIMKVLRLKYDERRLELLLPALSPPQNSKSINGLRLQKEHHGEFTVIVCCL